MFVKPITMQDKVEDLKSSLHVLYNPKPIILLSEKQKTKTCSENKLKVMKTRKQVQQTGNKKRNKRRRCYGFE